MLASEPTEQHVLFAGDADDAANGLYSTLTGSVCSTTAPGNPLSWLLLHVHALSLDHVIK